MSKILLITINETLRIGGVLTTATLGDSYFAKLTGYAGIEPYVWTITGALPTGISASVDSNGDYVFSGTPSTVGTFPIVVTLTDSEGRSVQRSFDFKSAAFPLTISGHLPNATVGGIASFAYTIGGGYGSKTITLYSGTLPTGISVSSAGVVSGTYTAAGSFSWRLLVTDSLGSQTIVDDSNTVAYATLAKTGALTSADIGYPVGGSITLSGGNGVYSVDASPVSGTRPPGNGLALVGAVYSDSSGVTTTAGSYSWTDRFHSGDGQSLDVPSSIVVAAATWYTPLFAAGGTGMVFDFNDLTSVYTDTAHTTLATTVGDAINSVRCQITGAYAVRTHGSATLAYDATNLKYYAATAAGFNMVASGTLPSAFTGDVVMTAIAVCNFVTNTQGIPVYIGPAYPTNPSSGNGFSLLQINDSGWVLEVAQFGSGRGRIAPQQNSLGVFIGRKTGVLSSGGSSPVLEIYANGTKIDTFGLQNLAANVTAMNLNIGRASGAQNIYCSAIINRSITPTEIATVSADAL